VIAGHPHPPPGMRDRTCRSGSRGRCEWSQVPGREEDPEHGDLDEGWPPPGLRAGSSATGAPGVICPLAPLPARLIRGSCSSAPGLVPRFLGAPVRVGALRFPSVAVARFRENLHL
jgi:hypothetical protein